MNLNFAANISTMFLDVDVEDRFNEAREAGFSCVEAQFLYDHDVMVLRTEKQEAGVDVALINSPMEGKHWCFDYTPFGLACVPGWGPEFMSTIEFGTQYCDYLKCPRLHILAGLKPENESFEDCEKVYLENLRSAIEQVDLFNVVGVIEPICKEVKPNYFLNSFEQAIRYIDAINNPSIRLLLDVYHLHKIEGNLEEGLRRYLPYASHIQISQSPGRNDPFSAGEIDYQRVFEIIHQSGYNGYIGLEYTPDAKI